jgi:hypothetical protein
VSIFRPSKENKIVMNKIAEIFTAWGISFNPNDTQSELASKRIEICNSCEHKKQNVLFTNVCELCGCALKAKVFTPVKGACPAGKWNDIDNLLLQNNVKPKTKNLRFVCAQPAIKYYLWQVEVMINNFIKMGVNPNSIDIVCWAENGVIPDEWSKLASCYSSVRFFFYNDTRQSKVYTSSIRPNILKQHWLANPHLRNEAIFYHDCDIVFTKPISEWISDNMINDNIWYGSDCRWYLDYNYILSKGEDVLDKMCYIIELEKDIVKENQLNTIGAQYIMKNVNYHFWEMVETHCEALYIEITNLNTEKKKENPTYHELQIWCADMWALLWNAWNRGIETKVLGNLQFSWATSTKEDWDRFNIFHNAGVTSNGKGLFYKADYMNSLPYTDELKINDGTASLEYWKIIKEVGENSCLIQNN